MKFILGKKIGMTQVFREDGTVVPVTRIAAGPCVVTQVKTAKKDGVNAVQIGYGEQKLFRLNKAKQGHLKGLPSARFLRDFRIEEGHDLKRGDTFDVRIFASGEKVQVVGRSKGRGFQGVVKRHGFKGSPASHGHKDQLRMPGSIGATDPARVFKGTRMAGHMGNAQVTVKNLEVVEVKPEENELLIKGAVPGARNGLLLIATSEGAIEIIEEVKAPAREAEKEVVEEKNESEGTEGADPANSAGARDLSVQEEEKPAEEKEEETPVTEEVEQKEEKEEEKKESDSSDAPAEGESA